MSNKLTPTQHAILSHALAQTQGKVLWFPETLKGGAKAKAIESLTAAWSVRTRFNVMWATALPCPGSNSRGRSSDAMGPIPHGINNLRAPSSKLGRNFGGNRA